MPKSIQERVASQEKNYKSMVGSLIDTIWVIDGEEMKFLYISHEAYETRGYSQKEIIGMSLEKVISQDSARRMKKVYEKAKKEIKKGIAKSYKIELQVIKKDSKKIWLEINSKLFKDFDGSLKIVGLSKDIGERKKAEFEKEELLLELKEALLEKKKLINQIKQLESLLPICSSCRRIRDNKNKKWWPFEKYIEEKSASKFTHTICPDCQDILYSKPEDK